MSMMEEKYIYDTLREIVGAQNLVTDAGELERYARDDSFVKPLKPLCAVKPATIEEVQGIVRMANRLSIALFPYSSGTTYQGAHIPTERGITLDLSRMNKVDLLDTVARNAIIEPGVTFEQLQKEANKVGLRVMTPIGVPSSGSVLATYLECTPLYLWPRYKTWETLTLKMVLPTGEVMGTGQMALPASERPYNWTTNFAVLNRLFFCAQGTLGIGVKAAITLTNVPWARKFIFVPLEEIAKVGEFSQKLMHQEAHDEYFITNNLYLACLLAKEKGEIEDLKIALPSWIIVIGISGKEEAEVAYKERDINDVLHHFGLKGREDLPGLKDAQTRLVNEIEHPKGMLNLRRYKGACNYIACMASKTQLKPLYDLTLRVLNKQRGASPELGWMIMPLNFGGSYYFEPNLYHNPDDREEHENTREMFLRISRTFIHTGGYFPRPYPLWAEEVYFRIGAYHRKVKMVKEMLDPRNIMNPGKLALK
jgi:FAD/FMN-containing dehydrogenase